MFSMIKLPEKHYSIKAVLYNVIATYGTYYGFPGIAFNVKDQNNYDFVMIRSVFILYLLSRGYKSLATERACTPPPPPIRNLLICKKCLIRSK